MMKFLLAISACLIVTSANVSAAVVSQSETRVSLCDAKNPYCVSRRLNVKVDVKIEADTGYGFFEVAKDTLVLTEGLVSGLNVTLGDYHYAKLSFMLQSFTFPGDKVHTFLVRIDRNDMKAEEDSVPVSAILGGAGDVTSTHVFKGSYGNKVKDLRVSVSF